MGPLFSENDNVVKIWADSRQTRIIKRRRGRKLHRWRIGKLEVKEKREELQEEMAKNAEQFSELLEIIGTTSNDIERDDAGARIIEGWEKLVNTTASKVIGKKLIVCNRAVKWWDEEVKEANNSTEKGTRKVYIEQNYDRMGGI